MIEGQATDKKSIRVLQDGDKGFSELAKALIQIPRHKLKEELRKEMLDEYDFSKGVRGKYVDRLKRGSNNTKTSKEDSSITQRNNESS